MSHTTPRGRTVRRSLAVSLVGVLALTVGLGTTAAGASTTGRRFAVVKAACNRKIDQRVVALVDFRARIFATRHLDAADRAEMVASIEQTIAVLQLMYRPAVDHATTPAALASACQSIFVDLRIFAVYLPQMRYSGMLDALGDFQADLQAQVTAAQSSGTDTAAWQALLDDAAAKLDDAAGKIPSVTPDTFNADPAGTRATWDAVHADLVGAFGDQLQVYRALHPAPAA
jgi:hypothetical protein